MSGAVQRRQLKDAYQRDKPGSSNTIQSAPSRLVSCLGSRTESRPLGGMQGARLANHNSPWGSTFAGSGMQVRPDIVIGGGGGGGGGGAATKTTKTTATSGEMMAWFC
ncbi:hypothetical protein E4U42_002626 [Claviceps africana]|uniref:Uncharacterized protein n=1 Tax=Claviceps africana TaxID=83212 RepID=A0A8K0JCN1_9HYPO|nr:hypothetical protein E4U42_002626 [Claviceps africana]